MNRNIIIAIIVVVIAAGGYYKYGMKPAATVATTAAATATKAADTATAAATTATAAATTATTAATTTATTTAMSAADITAMLDPAKFDPAAVAKMIDASALDDATKTTLKTAVTGAGTDVAKITAVIAQIKTAMKM